MKAKQVLKILKISRPTLCKYVKDKLIEVKLLPNKQYDYIDTSVYKFLNKELKRKSVVYARVSTQKQKQDLENQVNLISNFMISNGIIVDDIYKDIKSGMHFDRKEFQRLLNDVMNNEIETVYISCKDRFARLSYDLMFKLFENFGTNIVILNKVENNQEKELYEDLMSVIHSFSMKLYSSRRKKIEEKMETLNEN